MMNVMTRAQIGGKDAVFEVPRRSGQEADDYDLLAEMHRMGLGFVVRADPRSDGP